MLVKEHRDIHRQFKVMFEREGLDRIEERLSILEAFLGTETHLTGAELTKILNEKGMSLSEGFVAENLRLFSRYGFAQEKKFTGQVPRYEHRHLGRHHDHLICVRCGMILEFYSPEIEALQTEVARRMGFHDLQHQMEIYGLCSKCLQKREPAIPLTMASAGERVQIIGFAGGGGMERRLTGMGLSRGTDVEVIKSSGPGPLIVASGETRIALGYGMAKHILVSMIQNVK
ncbi:MAG: Fur family transcriptional regulator [Proteobacteria bacterium]|nr:Fur family transcriptional regulator [Pseudomonadota bacterium]